MKIIWPYYYLAEILPWYHVVCVKLEFHSLIKTPFIFWL